MVMAVSIYHLRASTLGTLLAAGQCCSWTQVSKSYARLCCPACIRKRMRPGACCCCRGRGPKQTGGGRDRDRAERERDTHTHRERALPAASRRGNRSLIAHYKSLLRIATTCSACSNLRERVMRVLVRRLPNTVSTQQKPVRKSIVVDSPIITTPPPSNIITVHWYCTTVTIDCRSALIHAELPQLCIPGSSLPFTPAAQQLGGALNILPSPFRWSWALVGFRWIRRRLDCARFGRSLIEAVHFCQHPISTYTTTQAHHYWPQLGLHSLSSSSIL